MSRERSTTSIVSRLARVGHRLCRVADPVADQQRVSQDCGERHRPVDVQLHVASRAVARGGHREGVGQHRVRQRAVRASAARRRRSSRSSFRTATVRVLAVVGKPPRHGCWQQTRIQRTERKERQAQEEDRGARERTRGATTARIRVVKQRSCGSVEHRDEKERPLDAEERQQQEAAPRAIQAPRLSC